MWSKNISVFAVIKYNNKYLLIKKNYADFKWSLPGGSVEMNESIIAAAIREIKEETGMKIFKKNLIFKGVFYNKSSYSIAFIYGAEIKKIKRFEFNKQEVADINFVSYNQITKLVSFCTKQKILFAEKKSGKKNIFFQYGK